MSDKTVTEQDVNEIGQVVTFNQSAIQIDTIHIAEELRAKLVKSIMGRNIPSIPVSANNNADQARLHGIPVLYKAGNQYKAGTLLGGTQGTAKFSVIDQETGLTIKVWNDRIFDAIRNKSGMLTNKWKKTVSLLLCEDLGLLD